MKYSPLAFLLPLAFALGCGSNSAPPDFSLAAAPNAITVQSGGSARSLSVTVGSVGSFDSAVTVSLSGLPAGVTASPSTLTVSPGQLGQFQLTASSSTTVSNAMITAQASSGPISHTATAALTITPAPVPDFTITAAPDSIALQGATGPRLLSITVAAVNGFTDPVNVSLSGLPAGVTATPSTLSVTPGQIGQFQLSASAAVTASTGTITATATSGSISHTTTAALTVSPAVIPDFTLSAAPATISMPGGGTRTLTVTVGALQGFADPVTVSLSGLPAGVTATPSTLSLTPGQLGQFQLTASTAVSASTATITATGTSSALSHTATAALTLSQAIGNAALSATSYDFGGTLVGTTLTHSVVTVTNTGAGNVTLSPTVSGDPSYSIVASSCGATLAAGASCTESVSYAPTAASGSTPLTATLNLGLGNVPAGTAQTVALTGVSAVLPQGTVTSTNNSQVALYTMTLPYPGSVTVNFGTDTTYGKQTWTQSTTQAGGTVSIFVAGMLANTQYHMQAAVQLQNGTTANDVDHTFTTGTSLLNPFLTVTTTPGLTPQSGLEVLTPYLGVGTKGIAITDLQGHVVWSYTLQNAPSTDVIEGVKMLPNGHILMSIGEGSTFDPNSSPAGVIIAIREIDLAGNLVREISLPELTDELKAKGYNLNLRQFHHEITPLPNGHWLVLSNTQVTYTNVTGYPGTSYVLGDVIIDLDQNLQPVWVWNTFDHLDVNRHPMQFPDWTHANAIVYSPDDHNILLSMRHQNWVIKIDYQDGAGTGNILWRLGPGGDFQLIENGAPTTDPTDWNYAQHAPSFVGPASAGIFNLTLMDNGDDRMFNDGNLCGTGSEPKCYSTVPVFKIDETAKTATLIFHQIAPTSMYNAWGGNAEPLDNGDYEYDLCGETTGGSDIFEITPDAANPTTVWHMHMAGNSTYRAFRLPSMYPGVQW